MSNKPQPKRELAIDKVLGPLNTVYFYASSDALEDIKPFGLISAAHAPNHYRLGVDKRYDFAEVVAYMEAYG